MLEVTIHCSSTTQPVQVTCYPGIITVLRAQDAKLLDEINSGFAKLQSPDTPVSLRIEGKSATIKDVVLWGFQAHDFPRELDVHNYLQKCGLHSSQIRPFLQEHGLLKTVEGAGAAPLPIPELRMLLLLGLLRQSNRPLILCDPFSGLPQPLREHTAIALMEHAEANGRAVLVTRLSSRPEAWVGRHTVHRFEVGNEVEQTIGPGANVAAFVQARHSGAMKRPLGLSHRLTRHTTSSIGAAFIAALVSSLVIFRSENPQIPPMPEQRSSNTQVPAPQTRTEGSHPPSSTPKLANASATEKKPPIDFGKHEELLLSEYPEEIEQAVREAFAKQAGSGKPRPVIREAPVVSARLKELFSEVPQAAPTQAEINIGERAFPPPFPPPPPDFASEQDWEQRRELMRQRFLEAIQQSSQGSPDADISN